MRGGSVGINELDSIKNKVSIEIRAGNFNVPNVLFLITIHLLYIYLLLFIIIIHYNQTNYKVFNTVDNRY